MSNPVNSILSAAEHAIAKGYSPVPIRPDSKRPPMEGWQDLRYKSKSDLESDFTEDSNIGLILGEASGGLVDIDLDDPLSISLAEAFLPYTSMIHGRESSSRSHYWYTLEDGNLSHQYRIHKFVDPTVKDKKKATLVEFRANGHQTLIPPSTHPSGEKYEWSDGIWETPAVVDGPALLKMVRWLSAAVLLARHWPEGARHDASLALAGGILRSGDYELVNDADKFIYLVAAAAGDEEAHDRSVAVKTTKARLKKNRKTVGWPALVKYMDQRVVDAVRGWLDPETPEFEDSDSIMKRAPVILGQEVEPHPTIYEDFLYEGMLTWVQGEPSSGKTLLLQWVVKEMCEAGKTVVLVDEESGLKMIQDRLTDMGMDPEAAIKNFWYYPSPGINVQNSSHIEEFILHMNKAKPDLIIYDSCADLLSASTLSENDNDDVNVLFNNLLAPIRQAGIAQVVIDHVTKSKDARGNWARGAGSKKSKADAAWNVTCLNEFSRNRMGRISLKRSKDRLGELPNSILFNIGGRNGRTIVERTEVVKDLNEESRTKYEKRIIEWLRLNAPTKEDAVSVNTLIKEVTGDKSNLNKALKELRDSIATTPLEMFEDGTSHMWFYAGDLEVDFS